MDWLALRGQVAKQPDATQKERARHFGVSRHCIWYALQRRELSREKTAGYKERDPLKSKA